MRRGRFWLVFAAAALLPGAVLAPTWRLSGLGAFEDDILYYYPARAYFHESVARGEWPAINPWTGSGRPVAADPQAALWYPFTWLFALLPPATAYPLSLWLHYSLALVGMYRLLRSLATAPNRGADPDRDGAAGGADGAAPAVEAPRGSDSRVADARADETSRGDDMRRPLHPLAALFGAVAFAFCGFLLAHRAHFAMQHAAAWTPWVFWRVRRYAQDGGAGRLISAAGVAALQALAGHVQVAAICALGALVYVIAERHAARRLARSAAEAPDREPAPGSGATGDSGGFAGALRAFVVGLLARRGRCAWVGVVAQRWALVWLCAGGLFAIQLVPTLRYLRECTRSQRGFADFVENSWRPVSIVNWFTPMLFGQRTPNLFDQPYWGPSHQCEQFAYAGILPLLLAGAAMSSGWRADAARRPWVILVGFSLLLALGEFGPVCYVLYFVPGGSLLRVPARALLLFNLGVAVLAALALHALLAAPTPRAARLRALLLRWTARPWLLALVLVGAPALLAVASVPLLGEGASAAARRSLAPWKPAMALALVAVWISTLAMRWVARAWQRSGVSAGLSGVLVADLALIGWTLDVPAGWPRLTELLNPPARDEWREAIPALDTSRLWVVTARRGDTPGEYADSVAKCAANTNYLARVPVLTDYGPLQPRAIASRFGFAPWGESDRTAALLAETDWMQTFHVGWVLLCDERWAAPANCELVRVTSRGWRLYRYSRTAGEAFALDAAGRATPLRVVWAGAADALVQVPRGLPAGSRLVLARVALPGWRAAVVPSANDVSAEAPLARTTAAEALLAVELPASVDAFTLQWTYQTPGLRLGAAVTVATFVMLLASRARWRRTAR